MRLFQEGSCDDRLLAWDVAVPGETRNVPQGVCRGTLSTMFVGQGGEKEGSFSFAVFGLASACVSLVGLLLRASVSSVRWVSRRTGAFGALSTIPTAELYA